MVGGQFAPRNGLREYVWGSIGRFLIPQKNRQAMEEAICEFNSKEMGLGL